MEPCPDPMDDPEGYHLWLECFSCPECEGQAEEYLENEWDEQTLDYGKTWVCSYCGGTGIDPAATWTIDE